MTLAFPTFATQHTDTETAGGPITIAASTWRWDGVSGSVRVSGGFWMRPGYVTAANISTYRVYVAGIEQFVALRALDGTFPDGSYRSIGTQFIYNLTNDTPVSAEIKINQGVRGTVDIAWVEPTRVTVLKKAVIAPTDPTYMCGTMVTLTPLTPASNDTGTDATWAAYALSSWLGSAAIRTGSSAGTAHYNHVTGCLNTYCRTGTRVWYQYAYDWATGFHGETGIDSSDIASEITLIEAFVPNTAAGTSCANAATVWNPEGLVHTVAGDADCGSPNEAFGNRFLGLAVAYWFTAYRQFKRLIAMNVNAQLWGTEVGYPTWRDRMSPWYGQRFNLRYLWSGVIYGYLTGCTTSMTTPFGHPAVVSWDYANYIDWLLDTLEYWVWNLPGDYRNGLVGQRHFTIDPANGNPALVGEVGADSHYGLTNFQLSLLAEDLMVIYDHILPDTRIPPWIKGFCDYWITQMRASNAMEQGIWPVTAWVGAYDNLPPATVATSTFTATTSIGNPVITWTGGNVQVGYLQGGHFLSGTGLVTGTQVVSTSGNNITLSNNATANGSTTVTFGCTPYDIVMYAPTFAWYYAYSGTALYNTWATRLSDNVQVMAAMAQTKNWAEVYGGTRQGFLYYRHGGTVRGTTGAHPTSITNPPVQASLG